MDNLNKEINEAHFNLIFAVINRCFFAPPRIGCEIVVRGRIRFANSKLLKMWCDCAENFEYKKLRKRIIDYNKIFVF